jgi:hypothetical protein
VCVPAVIGTLAVWIQVRKQNKQNSPLTDLKEKKIEIRFGLHTQRKRERKKCKAQKAQKHANERKEERKKENGAGR